jgi:chromosome segregation ATPase
MERGHKQKKGDPKNMQASSIINTALTPDEQQLIPSFLINKLNEELLSFEQTTNRRATELEKKARVLEEASAELNKRLVQQEMRMQQTLSDNGLLQKQNAVLVGRNEELRNEAEQARNKGREIRASIEEAENKRHEHRIGQLEEELRGARGRIAELEGSLREHIGQVRSPAGGEKKSTGEASTGLEEYKKKLSRAESINRELLSRIMDQKNQIAYLLKRHPGPDDARHNLDLIKLVQRLSKKNEELEGLRESTRPRRGEAESSYEDSISSTRLAESLVAEREEYRRLQKELHELRERGYALEVEYNRVFGEKNKLYNKVLLMTEEREAARKLVEEMREELTYLKIDLKNTQTKNMLLEDASQKLAEMNNEIIRNSVVMKENRKRIAELRGQLEESEERYNKYILDTKANTEAVIGKEIEILKKKASSDLDQVLDLEEKLKYAIKEQNKLKNMQNFYNQKTLEHENERARLVEELDGLKRSEGEDRMRLERVNAGLGVVHNSVEAACRDVDSIFSLVGECREGLGSLIVLMRQALEESRAALLEKESALYSLIESRDEDAVALLGKERNILKQENMFLRTRLEGITDSSDVYDRLSVAEEEGRMLRVRCAELEEAQVAIKAFYGQQTEMLSAERAGMQERINELVAETGRVREDLERSAQVVERYKGVVDKLRKVKDAYVKLKAEVEEKSVDRRGPHRKKTLE